MQMKKALPPVSFVLGGAASGKSAWAEGLALSTGLAPVYLATAQAFDAEMTEKIARHRESRGSGWRTVECPVALSEALTAEIRAGDVGVVDCLTLWLTNLLLGDMDMDAAVLTLIAALDRLEAPVVIVSNEVGQGIVPADALSRRFRNLQGGLNQRIAARADLVVFVTAGLPQVLKGEVPG